MRPYSRSDGQKLTKRLSSPKVRHTKNDYIVVRHARLRANYSQLHVVFLAKTTSTGISI